MSVVYRAKHVFDGREFTTDTTVVVDDDRIHSVGEEPPPGSSEVDLGEATILPGLIDAHVHLSWDGSADARSKAREEPEPLTVLRAADHAHQTLRAGVTAVRDLGSTRGVAVHLGRAIEAGIAAGPRVLAAGRAITITGGHVYDIGREADGADAVRRAVRREIKAGARCIKLMASGGALDEDVDEVGAPQLTVAEMCAAVEEANKAGRTVAAHAHSLTAIHNALDSGVHSIEHGTFLDDTAAERMSRTGTALIPTLSTVAAVLAQADSGGVPPSVRGNAEVLAARGGAALRHAREHRVPLVAGSDSGVPGQPHSRLHAEVAAMVSAGAPVTDALRAATSNAARLLGLGADHGTLETGKRADFVVVRGDLADDVTALAQPDMVVLGGVVVDAKA